MDVPIKKTGGHGARPSLFTYLRAQRYEVAPMPRSPTSVVRPFCLLERMK
jgi:hypothetical protein